MKYIKIFQSLQEQAAYDVLPCISTINKDSTTVKHHKKPTFAGLEISQGPLYYDGTNYVLKDSWNYGGYETVYGTVAGSYYFDYNSIGKLFTNDNNFLCYDSENEMIHTIYTDENFSAIEDTEDIFGGWRLPTYQEFSLILTKPLDYYWNDDIDWGDDVVEKNEKNEKSSPLKASAASNENDIPPRTGSTVNGFKHAICAAIQLTGITYEGVENPFGILLFPDRCNIYGCDLVMNNLSYVNSNITVANLNEYLFQGCVFLPVMAAVTDSSLYGDGGAERGDTKGGSDTKSSEMIWVNNKFIALLGEYPSEVPIMWSIMLETYDDNDEIKGSQNTYTEFYTPMPQPLCDYNNYDYIEKIYIPIRCVRGVSPVTEITQLKEQVEVS